MHYFASIHHSVGEITLSGSGYGPVDGLVLRCCYVKAVVKMFVSISF